MFPLPAMQPMEWSHMTCSVVEVEVMWPCMRWWASHHQQHQLHTLLLTLHMLSLLANKYCWYTVHFMCCLESCNCKSLIFCVFYTLKLFFSSTKQKSFSCECSVGGTVQFDLSVHLVTTTHTASSDTPEHRQTNVDTDCDLTGSRTGGLCQRLFFPLIIVCRDVVEV